MHLLFKLVADEFENNGIGMSIFAKFPINIPVSADAVKRLWTEIQMAQVNKDSTAKLTTKEVDLVYDTFNRMLAESCHLHVAFPSIQQLLQDND